MPITEAEAIDEPIDTEGEVIALDPQNVERVTWSVDNADDTVGVKLEMQENNGTKWFTRVEYPISKIGREDTVTIAAGEVRLYIYEPATTPGATADFYVAAGG